MCGRFWAGIDFGQGYLFGHPEPVDAYLE